MWNGDIIIAGSESGNLYVWDLVQGSPLATLQAHKGTVGVDSITELLRVVVMLCAVC